MEQSFFSPNTMAFMRALWSASKKKVIITTIVFFLLMLLVEGFISAIRGMGSPTATVSMYSVVMALFPLWLLACCIFASWGMSNASAIDERRVNASRGWIIRWTFFVLLPFLFYGILAYLLDAIIATPTYQPMPWVEGSEFFPYGNILPFIFFFSSFFFVVSTYFPRYTFLIGCGILILVYIIISIAWPQAVWWNPDNIEIPTPFMVYFLILAVLALPLSYFRIRCLHQDEEETASKK